MRDVLINTRDVQPASASQRISRVDQIVKKQDLYRVYKTLKNMVSDGRLVEGDLCFVIDDNHFYLIGSEGTISLTNGLNALRKPIVADSIGETGLADIVTKTLLATKEEAGIVQVGDNINVEEGVISVGKASVKDYGVMKVGTGFLVDDGTVSLDPAQLPDVNFATKDKAGIIKPGLGLTTDDEGELNIEMPLNERIYFSLEMTPYQHVVDLKTQGITKANKPEIYLSSTKLIENKDYTLDTVNLTLTFTELYNFKTTLEYIDFIPYEKVDQQIASPNTLGTVKIGDGIFISDDGTISTQTFRTVKVTGNVTVSDNTVSIVGYNGGEQINDPMIFLNGRKLDDSEYQIDNRNKILTINSDLLDETTSKVEYIDYPPKNKVSTFIDAQKFGGLYPREYAKSNTKIIAGSGIQINGNNTFNDNITISLRKELLDDFGNIRVFGKTYEEFVWTLKEDLIPKITINANTPKQEIIEVDGETMIINYTSNFSASILVFVDGVLLYPDKYKQNISNRTIELYKPLGTNSKVMIVNISYAI